MDTFWKPVKLKKQRFNLNLNIYPKRTIKENKIISRHPSRDFDKDGVMNWFDCRPLDKKKQEFQFIREGGGIRMIKLQKKYYQKRGEVKFKEGLLQPHRPWAEEYLNPSLGQKLDRLRKQKLDRLRKQVKKFEPKEEKEEEIYDYEPAEPGEETLLTKEYQPSEFKRGAYSPKDFEKEEYIPNKTKKYKGESYGEKMERLREEKEFEPDIEPEKEEEEYSYEPAEPGEYTQGIEPIEFDESIESDEEYLCMPCTSTLKKKKI